MTKERSPSIPEATDLANFGKREWMRQVVMNYSKHFAPLTKAAWYKAHMARKEKYESLKDDPQAGLADLVAIGQELRKRKATRELDQSETLYESLQSQLDAVTAQRDAFLAQLPKSEEDDGDDALAAQISERMASLEDATATAKEAFEAAETAASEDDPLFTAKPLDVDAVAEKVAELMSEEDDAFLDPNASEMADASGGEGGYAEMFGKAENATDLESIVEFLVSETGATDNVDSDKVKRGRAIIIDYEPLADGSEISSCYDCHDTIAP